LIDELLAEQQLTAIEKFSLQHDRGEFAPRQQLYEELLPGRSPRSGEQYAFEVNLDDCSGCKACVTACHSRNGLDEDESWRKVGLLHSATAAEPFLQTVTTACHHCLEPACLNGCPVLAYEKDPITGIVRHLDDQCIGCQYCVMKCPYEVPRFSKRLGIVRKCDLCTDRLEIGEAPACVQACPSGAIQIRIVQKSAVRKVLAGELPKLNGSSSREQARQQNAFLPDSPDPRITLPTTRFASKRGLPANAISADHGVPRLEAAHWPLVFMLVLTQAALGAFWASGVLRLEGFESLQRPIVLAAAALLFFGLGASILHLGQPLRAWRAFLGWRRSWLSREIITFSLFGASAVLAAASFWLPGWHLHQSTLTWITCLLGSLAVGASAMVYVDTRRPTWSRGIVFGNFMGTTFLLGAVAAMLALGWQHVTASSRQSSITAALVGQLILFSWRRAVWERALRNPTSPIHENARAVHELLARAPAAQKGYSLLSILLAILALIDYAGSAVIWMSLAAVGMFAGELVARYQFFAGAAGKRMPGGIGI
jgi:Fe-S-cluster-containing dehydrogenase component/DMSO reductase anchor subunit